MSLVNLDPEAYRLLLAIQNGSTLEEACAASLLDSRELPAQSAARIQEWFARWMEFGWFCSRENLPKSSAGTPAV